MSTAEAVRVHPRHLRQQRREMQPVNVAFDQASTEQSVEQRIVCFIF